LRLQVVEARACVERLEAELKEVKVSVETHLANIHKLSERAASAEANSELATQRAVAHEAQAKSALLESIEMQTCVNEEKKARKVALEELSNAKADSQATIQGQLNEIQGLKCSLEVMRTQMSGKETALEEAIAELSAAKSELGQMRKALDAAREEASSLHLSMASAEKALAEHSTSIAEREQALAALRREAVAKETAHAEMLSEKDAMLASKDLALAQAHREAEDKTGRLLSRLTKEATQAQASLEATTKRLHALQAEHSQALGDLAGRETAMAEKGSELEMLQKDHARTVAERDAMLAGQEKALDALRKEVAAKSEALTAASEEASRLQSSFEEKSKMLLGVERKQVEVLKKLGDLEKTLAEKDAALEELRKEGTEQRAEAERRGEELRKRGEDLGGKDEEMVQLKSKLDAALQAVREEATAVEAKDDEIRSLSVSVEKLTRTIAEREEAVLARDTELASARGEIEAKLHALREIESRAQVHAASMAAAQTELAERDRDLAFLKSEMAAKDSTHGKVLLEKDAMLASKDQALAEARREAEGKTETLARVSEEERHGRLRLQASCDAAKLTLDELREATKKQILLLQTGSEGVDRRLDEAVCELRGMATRMDEQEAEIQRLTRAVAEEQSRASKMAEVLTEREQALAALRREAMAKETAHAGVLSERDEMLASKDQALAEARRETEDKAAAWARATEEATQAQASLEATTKRLHALQAEHSQALGDLAGRETAMVETGSVVEADLRASMASLTRDFECKCQEVIDLQAEMAGFEHEHELQMQETKERHDKQLADMLLSLQEQECERGLCGQSAMDSKTEKLVELQEKHSAEISALTESHQKTTASLNTQHSDQLQSLSHQHQIDRHDTTRRIDQIRQQLEGLHGHLGAALAEVRSLCSATEGMHAFATSLGSALRHDLHALAGAFLEVEALLKENADKWKSSKRDAAVEEESAEFYVQDTHPLLDRNGHVFNWLPVRSQRSTAPPQPVTPRALKGADAAAEEICTVGHVASTKAVSHEDELVAATETMISDLLHIRSCFADLVMTIKADREHDLHIETCQARTFARVIDLQQGLHGVQDDLAHIVGCTKLAMEEDAQCRMSFELGKGICDEVEATLDRLQHSVRLSKDEARLRKETSVLLDDDGSSIGEQLREAQERVRELEAKLQRDSDEHDEVKDSFDAQTSRLEEELEEAAELLQATCTAEDVLRAELEDARSQHAAAVEREEELQRDLNYALACLKAVEDERETRDMLSGSGARRHAQHAADDDSSQGGSGGSTCGAGPALRRPASDRVGEQSWRECDKEDKGLHPSAPHANATAAQALKARSSVDGVESGGKLGEEDVEVAFNHLTTLTSLQEKVAAQHMRILELEDELDRGKLPESSHRLQTHTDAVAPLLAKGRQHVGGDLKSPTASAHHLGPPERLCALRACEPEDVLEDVRADLMHLCASLCTQDGFDWDEETGSDDVFDMLQVVQRALRQKHLQVKFLTESLVNAPSTGEVGTLTAQKAMLTAQLAVALDRLKQAERRLPSAAAEGERDLTDKARCAAHTVAHELPDAERCAEDVQGRVDEMALLLAAKETEVGMLQMKVMAQEQVVQVMTEHQHATAQRLHAWLLKIGSSSPASSAGKHGSHGGRCSPGGEGQEGCMGHGGKDVALRSAGGNGLERGTIQVLSDVLVRESVGTVLLEREALLTSSRAKDDKIAALEQEHKALYSTMLSLQEASREALAQRDATINALQSALRFAGFGKVEGERRSKADSD